MTTIWTCAVPRPLWRPSPRARDDTDVIQDLIQDVLSAERLLAKRVREDADRDRHEDTCELLESAVIRRAARRDPLAPGDRAFPAFVGGRGYLALLAELWARRLDGRAEAESGVGPGRLGASVVPPEEVAAHLDAFSRFAGETGLASDPDVAGRVDFLRSVVLPGGWGVVEGQAFGLEGGGPDLTLRVLGPDRVDDTPRSADSEKIDVEELFRRRVARALEDGSTVNMNNQNHVTISRVLAEFLEAGPRTRPGEVRVVYADGSEAAQFPLRCLRSADPQVPERVLPLALMSMRHLLLDESVVASWLRNREIDQSSTLGRSDEYCHERSVRQLHDLRRHRDGRRLLIHLYHTGYEPAVVGFYRAAVEAIRGGGDWLRIVPHYFLGPGSFDTGPSWPPLSGREAVPGG